MATRKNTTSSKAATPRNRKKGSVDAPKKAAKKQRTHKSPQAESPSGYLRFDCGGKTPACKQLLA